MEAIEKLEQIVKGLFNDVDECQVILHKEDNLILVHFKRPINNSDFINIQEIHKATQLEVLIYPTSNYNLICKFYLCQ